MECSNAEEVSEDGYGQFQDELLGRKREVVVARNKLQTSKNEIQDKKSFKRRFLRIAISRLKVGCREGRE